MAQAWEISNSDDMSIDFIKKAVLAFILPAVAA
jgi:hypothetical protein